MQHAGDVNFELAGDSGDLGCLLARCNASSVLNADIDRDGEVNSAGLAFILGNFGDATDAATAPWRRREAGGRSTQGAEQRPQ